MRKFLRRMAIGIAVFAAVAAATAFLYMHHPLFGALPQGDRLVRILASENYRDGSFQNQVHTPFLTDGATQLSIRIDNLLAKKGVPRPKHALPTHKTDIRALQRDIDLAIWLGHSSWYIQLGGQRILIDPVFSNHASPLPGVIPAFDGTNLYSASDMPPIDALLITHDHYDHLDYSTMLALRPVVKQVIAGLGVGAHLEAWGYDPRRIHELDWYETHNLNNELQIHATPARHYSGRTFERNQSLWVGFALTTLHRRLFLSGDTGYANHFVEVGKRYGPFDWVTLDSGQYDRRWANLHMNPEEAAQAVEELGTRALTPEHVGRFSLASHDWNAPFERIAQATRERSYALWTPMIGQPIYFDGRPQNFENWWKIDGEAT
jgi:L-ascorbate metabolism protein UlaG (beta-lactamase superfamily)